MRKYLSTLEYGVGNTSTKSTPIATLALDVFRLALMKDSWLFFNSPAQTFDSLPRSPIDPTAIPSL